VWWFCGFGKQGINVGKIGSNLPERNPFYTCDGKFTKEVRMAAAGGEKPEARESP
jgi:hypothetical protein